MNISEYKLRHSKKKPNAEILERWQTRIVARSLHTQGEAGARQYLADYGKGIAAPKVIMLAIQADNLGAHEMALGFWKKAAELEGVTLSDVGNAAPDQLQVIEAGSPQRVVMDDLPSGMQPGTLAPMQPVDAQSAREHYIDDERYWGQPKRDGNKLIVFASAENVYYQSRSLKLRGAPSLEFEAALKECARRNGTFVVEGELFFLDYDGGEHRTSAQAATANIELDHPTELPALRYMIFSALWNGRDLREHGYAIRVLEGDKYARELNGLLPGVFEHSCTARSRTEKLHLIELQQKFGREGEIWFDACALYQAGKPKDERVVRTKYLEEQVVIVTSLTPTTGEGRLFGAAVVSALDGTPLGCVGSGFSRADQEKLVRAHALTPGQVRIEIRHQKTTENHQLWHARFVDFA